MSQFRVSDAARSDLDEIWLYIGQDNSNAADKFVRSLVAKFAVLASMPDLGRKRDELLPRLLSLPFGRYVIFYRPIENGDRNRSCAAWSAGFAAVI